MIQKSGIMFQQFLGEPVAQWIGQWTSNQRAKLMIGEILLKPKSNISPL